MRKYLLYLIILIQCAIGTAQEIKVKSFSMQMEPMTVSMQKKDLNGFICPLIKVQLPIAGCKFEGNVIDVRFDVNEYLVYLSPDSKVLGIKCPNYTPLRVNFIDFNIPKLVAKGIYVLELQQAETEEELIYNIAKDAFQNGNYQKAEEYSTIGIQKGYKTCNDIFMYLLTAGYYDNNINQKESILYQVQGYIQGMKHSSNENDYKNKIFRTNAETWIDVEKKAIRRDEKKTELLNYGETMEMIEKELKELRLKRIEDDLNNYQHLINSEPKDSTTSPLFNLF